MLCFPTDPKHATDAVHVLGVPPATRVKIAANLVNFKTASWRLKARHRYRGNLGSWNLCRMEIYKEFDRKSFLFVFPNANIAKLLRRRACTTAAAATPLLAGWLC